MDIDGKQVAETIRKKLKEQIAKEKLSLSLAFVLVGEDHASQTYVRMKEKACKEVGINSLRFDLPETVSEKDLLKLIHNLNNDKTVTSILVQMPLPKHINASHILLAIDPKKDVDGFHPMNVGKMVTGDPQAIIPCTPLGVLKLLESYKVDTDGKSVVVLGRSNIVGRPLANLLSQKRPQGNATVTLAHSGTKNLHALCAEADILIAAIGKPLFVTKDMVKPGAVVIDVGINRLEDRLVGDVDYASVAPIAKLITPVPGGVGPMTIAMLLYNTIMLSRLRV